MTRLVHRRPCAECPWRRTSVRGYLGGNDAYVYADSVSCNTAPACHLNDRAFCVGALTTANNSCVQLHRTEGAMEAQATIPVRVSRDFFSHAKEFYEYHAGAEWKPRYQRILEGEIEL